MRKINVLISILLVLLATSCQSKSTKNQNAEGNTIEGQESTAQHSPLLETPSDE